MLFYLSLMLIIAILSCNNARSNKKLKFIGILLISILGLKGETIGNDTPQYIELFYRLKRLDYYIDKSSRFEAGYQLYNKIIGNLFDSHQMLFVLTAIVCITCICYGIKKNSINWIYSLFLFIGLRFFYFFMSGLRQSIAVSLIFVSYTYLKRDKLIPFILLVLLGSTFHLSSLIFIFAWPISKMRLKRHSLLKLIILTIVVYIFFNPLFKISLRYLPEYYSLYLNTEAVSTNNILNYVDAIIPCVVILFAKISGYLSLNNFSLNTKKVDYIFPYKDIDTQIIFLAISASLSIIATRASILDRLVQYYWIFSIITITNILFSIKNKRKRTLSFLIITFLVIIFNLIVIILRPEWNKFVPYKFFWQY